MSVTHRMVTAIRLNSGGISRMRKIYGLYTVQGTNLTEIELTSCSPKSVFLSSTSSAQNLALKYHVTVDGLPISTSNPKTISKVAVDISALFTMTNLLDNVNLDIVTWDQIAEKITDHMIIGYSYAIPDFQNALKSILNLQLLGTSDFELFYTMYQTPEDRNVKFRRWQLLDLGVTKLNKKHPVQLENALLSVNGLISKPVYWKGELIMPRGAQFMHSCSSTRQASVTLLDLSSLGKIECIPFSRCSTRVEHLEFGADIQLTLPVGTSLKGKSVLMVLAHSLFFPESLRVMSDHTIKISPHRLPLGSCLLKQRIASHQFNDWADAISTEFTIQDYVTDEMFNPDHHGAFFVLIDTPTLYIRKKHTWSHAQSTLKVTQPEVHGFLWDRTSCSIFDNVCVPYESMTDYYSRPGLNLNYLTIDNYSDKHHAVEDLHPFYQQYIPNNYDSDMYVVQIIRP